MVNVSAESNTEIRWELRFGEHVIAKIADAQSADWPWTYGTLVNSPEFEMYREYFTDSEMWDDNDVELDQLISTIESMGEISLHDLKTERTYNNPTFNQNGDSVWFRLHEHELLD